MSSVEQDTIDCEYLAYFEQKLSKKSKNTYKRYYATYSKDASLFSKLIIKFTIYLNFTWYFMQLFCADATVFFKKSKIVQTISKFLPICLQSRISKKI